MYPSFLVKGKQLIAEIIKTLARTPFSFQSNHPTHIILKSLCGEQEILSSVLGVKTRRDVHEGMK